MAESFTFVVEKQCPICEQMTHVTKTRSRVIVEKTDVDLCTHYKDFNPYLYTICVCEHCGYAADEKTFMREMNALKLARETTGIRDCTIVTWDDEDESDGVRIVPVWKWLLHSEKE